MGSSRQMEEILLTEEEDWVQIDKLSQDFMLSATRKSVLSFDDDLLSEQGEERDFSVGDQTSTEPSAASCGFLAEAAAQQAMRAEKLRAVIEDSFFLIQEDEAAILVEDCVALLSSWPVREFLAVSMLCFTVKCFQLIATRFPCNRLV